MGTLNAVSSAVEGGLDVKSVVIGAVAAAHQEGETVLADSTDAALAQKEIGWEFGATRERICQLEAKALRKLRYSSPSAKLPDFLE
jgi:hypothetical protein